MKSADKADAIILSALCAMGVAGIIAATVAACSARQVAKTEYEAQSQSCVKIYDGNLAAQRSCLEYVRDKWTKAGAPPAAVDGGSHE